MYLHYMREWILPIICGQLLLLWCKDAGVLPDINKCSSAEERSLFLGQLLVEHAYNKESHRHLSYL
jgi:hypothetical protein